MAEEKSNIAGVTGGTVTGSKVAGVVYGGMGNQGQQALTCGELVAKLKADEFSAETIKKFNDKKITGQLFTSMFDETLTALKITDEIEVLKLKGLKNNLSQ